MKVSHYLQGSIILIHGRVYKLRLHTIIQGAVTKQTKKEYGQNVNWEIKIEYWNTHELTWFKNSKKKWAKLLQRKQLHWDRWDSEETDGTMKKRNNNGHKPKVLIIKISVIG